MRQLLQKYTGIFSVLLLLLTTAMDSHAQSVTVLRQTLDSNKIAVNDSIVVTDATYFDVTKLPKLDTPYSVKNVVTLKINEYSKLYLPSEFTASVKVRITYTKPDFKTDTLSQTLTINYKSTDAYTSRSSFVFSNAHKVKVEVLSVTITAEKDILPALTLENEMYVRPVYKLACTDAVTSVSNNGAQLVDTSDELTVQWSAVEGADAYDLEWTHIDSTALFRYGTPLDTEAVFRNNATRVTITGTSYNIPLMFDEPGIIFYRVRSVQERSNNVRMETVWSSKYSAGFGKYGYSGHERSLNWQSAISFAEEGKRKVVVNYYDGSLHSRQTVTKDNSTNTAIVAETMYDYQGRPAIQVMPAPTLSNAVKYFRSFNNAANGAEYDKNQYDTLVSTSDYLTGGAAAMSSLSGANQYYSANNPESNQGMNRYLPNSNGYAFTQTEYTQDNTGRISRQSGVGDVFKLGSNHETRYQYGSPSQEELDLLFGTDVGDKTHYFKNSVKDANGQVAITYVDMHGRTIATALAGSPDSANLSALPGVTPLTYLDTLSRQGSNQLKDLTLETVESKIVSVDATYTFRYKLNTPSVKMPDCNGVIVDYPVRYDLYITITDDANNQRLPGKKAYERVFRNYTAGTDPTANSTVQNIDVTDSLALTSGSYLITKRLVVNSDALAYYRDNIYMAKSLCKTLDDFINDQRALQPTTDCLPSCQACFVSIGSWDNFRANYMSVGQIQDTAASRGAAWTAYEAAIDACNALCDSTAQTTNVLKQMLLDVTAPSGQYAVPEDSANIFSIFYSDSDVKLPPYQDTLIVYLDENGKKDTVYDEQTGAWVIPQKLTATQFGSKFKSSWANALLKYHPEYCKYLTYIKYKSSYDWDDKFSKIDTYADAVAAGYLNPLGDSTYGNFTIVTANVDPIKYTSIKDGLNNRINNYMKNNPSNVSMYTMAMVRVKCPSNGTCYQTSIYPTTAFGLLTCTADLDMAWRAFRESYKTEKHNLIDAVIDAASCSGTPKISSATLIDSGFQPVFYVADKAVSEQGPSYLNQNQGSDSVRVSMDSSYAQNCRAYIADWYSKLIGCIDSVTLTNVILPRLVEVCKQGSDISHPFGSSTVAPGSTYTYKSFQAVLDAYYAGKNLQAYTCNAYQITSPAPYDQQPAYYDITLYSKPDDCQCTKLNALKSEYTAKGTSLTFAAYLTATRGIHMTQANLDSLLSSCNGNSTCVSLTSPITIPPALQCYTGDICIGCKVIDTLYNSYISKYPGNAPVRETTDSVQMKKNQLFENYMNVRLGFNKHYWEYMDFRTNQCQISDTTGGTIIARVSNVSDPVADTILLCGKSVTIFTTVKDTINNCSDSAFLVYSKGYDLYNNYKDVLKNNFDKIYRDTAIAGGLRELFTLGYGTSEYQYTLYYYDQAGNLTRTIPPAGVVIDRSAAWKANLAAARRAGTRFVPAHQMATEYRYNTLNQIASKKTPDDSITNYWYDKLGRAVVSQNVKQSLAKNYSYTNFDALGRPIEVGEITSATAMTSTISRSEQSLASWLNAAAATRTQITKTVYDIAYYASDTVLVQDNLRNRVSWMAMFDDAASLNTTDGLDYSSGTFYSYDIHGNVKSLLQDYKHGNMLINGNRFKTINYQYDLISGKVNFVAYEPGKKDAFYHRYSYDAENRLTNVETSHDSIYWENDAWYEYYKHGPLARAVIGQQQVQGIDYAYTLQGWLKGINSTALTPTFDMGGDGASGSLVAKDAFGFGIHYFGSREYTPVNTSVKPFAVAVGNSPLFNGNISAISQSISTLGTPLEYTYSYDVLNRLTGMVANKGLDSLTNSWTNAFTALSDFKEAVTYDGNGNILTYNRNGNKTFAGSPLGMDSLTYHYCPGTNKLSYVTDLVRGANYGNDIDNQSIGNYKYDSIGNMVSDVRAGVDSIKWNVYGKIAKIYKHDTTSIVYAYDAAGNRISKSVISKTQDTVQTFYIRDATGNILSTYTYRDTSVNSGQLSQIEANLYGSSRLGMTTLATNVQDATPTPTTSIIGLGYGKNITFTRGKKFFELTNHLGNVLATVSDRKTGVSLNNSSIDSYNPVINSAQEYYPFGMLMPGRGGHIGTGRNVAGSTVVMNGDTIPATLTVTQRTNNTPGTYMATQVISFEGEFASGTGDELTTLFVDQTSADPGTESGVSYGITAKGYPYGFNGKENDNDVKGEGNEQDYGMRVYDPLAARFLSVDPITFQYPELTPYQFASDRPIDGIDQDGLEWMQSIPYSIKWKSHIKLAYAKQVANQNAPTIRAYIPNWADTWREWNDSKSSTHSWAILSRLVYQIVNDGKIAYTTATEGKNHARGIDNAGITNYKERVGASLSTLSNVVLPIVESGAAKGLSLGGNITDNSELTLFRKGNTGAFSELEVPMRLKDVKSVAERAGVGLKGIKIKIDRDFEKMASNFPYVASAQDKTITLFPKAFSDYETLVKTLGHERTHIMQYSIWGTSVDMKTIQGFENAAYGIENTFWEYYKKEIYKVK
ncbi:RHS repeat-associated core domain-containing protein [Chitinophaga sp. LS1]|uniref:RHS repeat protein n=1 Tax=Chitinophaga sp. LS1 TaxID=3051176 RepID=UPI002AAB2454|nr:RHS repeat-associated core domain-containing protein [Chitinophaga sp. LS1]WPV63875.1 RHS repeat-associated core domain-containing protein [Chitinophaga sp. LS1]